MSQIINTWTFGRLTPDGNEGVGVEIGFLECTYGTKYYVIDQRNGHINAIYDDRIELTEFTGHFSPFDLDELEMKVCRLADCQQDENDFPQGVSAPQIHQVEESYSNLGLQSIEDLTGMGFSSPNYSLIPPVRYTAPQRQRSSVPTSMPIPDGGLCLNTLDPTHYRGNANIINSFANPEESQKKSSKGGKVKSSQGAQPKNQPQLSTSSHTPSNNTWRPLVHCSACGGDHLRKDCHHYTFCTKCRSRSHNTEMCHAPTKPKKESDICIYFGSKSHSSRRCTSRLNDKGGTKVNTKGPPRS